MTTNVSVSKVQSYLACEQKYWYQYVGKIEPLSVPPAMQLGRLLHNYLEEYYRRLKEGRAADVSAGRAWRTVASVYGPELEGLAQASLLGGNEDEARKYSTMLDEAKVLAREYHRVRGRGDASRWEILRVEAKVQERIGRGIYTKGQVDLVVRDERGRIALVEHKTTQNVPSFGHRLRDFQTPMYALWLPEEIDLVVWNYLRTKPLSVPRILKNGTVSKDKSVDTTAKIVLATLHGNGQTGRGYLDLLKRAVRRERAEIFPRYEHVIPDVRRLADNFASASRQIVAAERRWSKGDTPVRNISMQCDWCEFRHICNAALTGGDEEDVINMRYRRRSNGASH